MNQAVRTPMTKERLELATMGALIFVVQFAGTVEADGPHLIESSWRGGRG